MDVHYELYDGIPCRQVGRWPERAERTVRLNQFTSEMLAVVEEESAVEAATPPPGSIYVESDYAFDGMDSAGSNHTTFWAPDPQYATQVNYDRRSPRDVGKRPPIGPDVSFLPAALSRAFAPSNCRSTPPTASVTGWPCAAMYRTLAPWATENPILMHVRQSEPEA